MSRVHRLEERVRPLPEDLAAKLRFMSDEELDGRIVALVEKAGGLDALFAQMGWDAEAYPEARKMLREHKASGRAT